MISFIIPCYNEEILVKETIGEIQKVIKKINLKNYELLIIFDNGNSKTRKIVQSIAKSQKNIKLTINKINLGYGGSVKVGIKKASKKFLMWIPGDNSHPNSEIIKIIKNLKKFDGVTTYYTNAHLRASFRRIFTNLYTPVLNFLFNMNMKYFNGITLVRSKLIKSVKLNTNSHNFSFELWVKLNLRNKIKNIAIIQTILNDRINGSTAFKIKNSLKVMQNVIILFFYFWFNRFLNFIR
jgi:glycosyltransferase involved in cell wall biosynthesis